MNKPLRKIFICFVISMFIPFTTVFATSLNRNTGEDAKTLVSKILGSGIQSSNESINGTVYTFDNGLEDFGIESGIILDTSGTIDGSKDDDLASLMSYTYGGHTSSLEFELVADGDLLNFNYVFASLEFDQSPQYNDVFGLFISVNDSEYENIALIDRSDDSKVPVNITNLRAGLDGTEMNNGSSQDLSTGTHSLFTAYPYSKTILDENENENIVEVDGISNVFNARKQVKVGDKVKIKFVIADVSDTGYDSYVMIEAESLSFTDSRVNYKKEVLYNLNADTTYTITLGNNTYEVTSDSEGTIPLKGQDNSKNEYDLIGKTLTIKEKDNVEDKGQKVTVNSLPEAPADPIIPNEDKPILDEELEVQTTTDSIIIYPEEGKEYSIDGINWESSSEKIVFDGLDSNQEYTIYSRYYATEDNFASNINETKITIKPMLKDLGYTKYDYSGYYDNAEHNAYVTSDISDVKIEYSTSIDGEYSTDVIKYKNVGTYTVYYKITKDGYYPASGKLTVKIELGLYKISFDKNGGTGEMADITGLKGLSTLPANGFKAPLDKKFKGWSLSNDGDVITKIDMAKDEIVYAIWEDYTYTYLNGDNQEFFERNIDNYTFRIDGDYSLFESVKIGGLELIKDEDYLVTEGSTIITFTEFGLKKLNELKVGIYDVIVKYTNSKTATGKLKIKELEENPKTYDNIISIIIICIISFVGLISSIVFINKRKTTK